MSKRIMCGVYLTKNEKEKLSILAQMRRLTCSAWFATMINEQFVNTFGPTAQISDIQALLPENFKIKRANGATIKITSKE